MTDLANNDAGQADSEAGGGGVPSETDINEADQGIDEGGSNEAGGEAGSGDQQANGESKEPVKFDAQQQEVFDNAMHGKTKILYDQRQENTRLQQENAALQAKLPKSERPIVPDMPDTLDENYTALMAARDTAMQAASAFDTEAKNKSEQALRDQQTQQQQTAQTIQTAVSEYQQRGITLGIKTEDLLQAEQTLMNAGLSVQVQAFLIDQPNGPQITAYLAKHPTEADALIGMTPMTAAAKIGSEIATKATEYFKVGKQPPDPTENLNGQGSQEGLRGPPKATYE